MFNKKIVAIENEWNEEKNTSLLFMLCIMNKNPDSRPEFLISFMFVYLNWMKEVVNVHSLQIQTQK